MFFLQTKKFMLCFVLVLVLYFEFFLLGIGYEVVLNLLL